MKSFILLVLLIVVGVLIYFIVNLGFFSVRLLLLLVFINFIFLVGMYLISRVVYCNGVYMYRKDDVFR